MKKNTSDQKRSDTGELYEKFNSLPLDQKFASLLKMELTAIGDAINFVVKDPMKVIEKIGDTLSEIGTKIENEVKKAASADNGKKDKGAGPRSSRSRGAAEPAAPPAA